MDKHSPRTFSLKAMDSDPSLAVELADYLEETGLLTPPSNLKSSILNRSRQMDVQLIASTNRISRKAELFCYGMKIGFAVTCSVAALAAMPKLHHVHHMISTGQYTPIYVEAYNKVQEWNGKIDSFSKSLFHLEVSLHDK